jgi:hypothetical protein
VGSVWIISTCRLKSLFLFILLNKQRRIVAYLDNFPLSRDLRQARLASHMGMISLRELQPKTQEDLETNLATPWVGG